MMRPPPSLRRAGLGVGLLLALGWGTAAAADAVRDRALDRDQLTAFVDGVVTDAMAADHIAGVGVAIVDRSGPLLVKGYGEAAPGRPVGPDTLFPQQSISKTFIWIAVMQLAEQGRLRLDDPANRYLPPALQIADHPGWRAISLRDLMSHTAGFEDSALGHLIVDDPRKLEPLERYLAHHRVRRVRPPGQIVVYSNYGAALAGEIVARVSGMGWETYAERRILGPLGMTGATFRQPYGSDLAAARGLPAPMDVALRARLSDDYRLRAGRLERAPREFTADTPAGALTASPAAMAAYLRALLDPAAMARAGVLSAPTALAMREPLVRGPAGFGDMRHGFAAMALPGAAEGWGHGGDSVYPVANFTVISEAGLALSVSANTTTGHRLAEQLRQRIAERFLDARTSVPVYGPQAAASARRYAGAYENLRRPYARSERGLYDLFIGALQVSALDDGDLLLRPGAGPPRRFVPLGDGVFRDAMGAERIAFRPLNGGIGLYQPFADTVWERLPIQRRPVWTRAALLAAMVAAVATVGASVRRRTERRAGGEIVALAAALAWLGGMGLFVAGLARAIASETPAELMFAYPSTAWAAALWTWAVAAGFTAILALLTPAMLRVGGWRRRLAHGARLAVWLSAAALLAREQLLGFWGW